MQDSKHSDGSEEDMDKKKLMPWFRANMTAWLYEYEKKHMSKHGRVYSMYQLDIGAGAFKRASITHRNAVTTAVRRTSRIRDVDGCFCPGSWGRTYPH